MEQLFEKSKEVQTAYIKGLLTGRDLFRDEIAKIISDGETNISKGLTTETEILREIKNHLINSLGNPQIKES
jgi:hypothetical protein